VFADLLGGRGFWEAASEQALWCVQAPQVRLGNAAPKPLVPVLGTCYAVQCASSLETCSSLSGKSNPETKVSLLRWHKTKAAQWASTDDVQSTVPKAKVLNRERVRFEVAGGNYRLVVAFDFRRQIAFVKFIGTHAQYDSIDASEF
jgi:mRNA interferase HigB